MADNTTTSMHHTVLGGTARCVSCGGALSSPYAPCEPCTGVPDPALHPRPASRPSARSATGPTGVDRGDGGYGTVWSLTRSLVAPQLSDHTRAVSIEMTSMAVICAIAAAVLTVVGTAPGMATRQLAGGVDTFALSDDHALTVFMVVIAVGALASVLTAKFRNGWGVGLLAGVCAGIPMVYLRSAAALIGDGGDSVSWGWGAGLMTVAVALAVVPLACAVNGVTRGRDVASLPYWATPAMLGVALLVLALRRDGLADTAGGLSNSARVWITVALLIELFALVLAGVSRSRLGGGLLCGLAATHLAMIRADVSSSPLSVDLGFAGHRELLALVLVAAGVTMTVGARTPES